MRWRMGRRGQNIKDRRRQGGAGAVASRARPRSHRPLMLRFASDLTAVRQWVGEGLSRLVAAGIAAGGAAAAIVYLDPSLRLGVAAAFALQMAAALWLGPSFRKATAAARRKRGGLAAAVSGRLLRARVPVAFGSIARERRQINKRGRWSLWRHAHQAAARQSHLKSKAQL